MKIEISRCWPVILGMTTALFSVSAIADVFAIAGVKGDRKGRTVLTTEPCDVSLEKIQYGYSKATLGEMRRAFYYTSKGETNEGCWKHDAGSVVLLWPTENILRRWPVKNFEVVAAAPTWD
jgi:hypothetical protein